MSKAMPEALTNGGTGYDPDSLVFRFLNNNDTDMRFVSIYGVNYYRTALAMMLTLPGIPCIYTGDEVGAQFLPYEQLSDIDWADPNGLRPYVERLIHLRRDNPSLYSREWQQLEAEPSVPLFAYLRQGVGEENAPIVVVLNFSAEDIEASVTLPAELSQSALIDLWTAESFAAPADGAFVTSIPAWGFRILNAGAGS
jgi:glycosidase